MFTLNSVVCFPGLVTQRNLSRCDNAFDASDCGGSSLNVDMLPQSLFIDDNRGIDDERDERVNRMPTSFSSDSDEDRERERMDDCRSSHPHPHSNYAEEMLVSVSQNNSTEKTTARLVSRIAGDEDGSDRGTAQQSPALSTDMMQVSVTNSHSGMGHSFSSHRAAREHMVTETSFTVGANRSDRRSLQASFSRDVAGTSFREEDGVTAAAMQASSPSAAKEKTQTFVYENGADKGLTQTCVTEGSGTHRPEQMDISGTKDINSVYEDGLPSAEPDDRGGRKVGLFLPLPPLPTDIDRRLPPLHHPHSPLLSSCQYGGVSAMAPPSSPLSPSSSVSGSGVARNSLANSASILAVGDMSWRNSSDRNTHTVSAMQHDARDSRLLQVPHNAHSVRRFFVSAPARTFQDNSTDSPHSGFAISPSPSLTTHVADDAQRQNSGVSTSDSAGGFTLPPPLPQTSHSLDGFPSAPARTHSNSSTESMDSGVWSLSPSSSLVGNIPPQYNSSSLQPTMPPPHHHHHHHQLPASAVRPVSDSLTLSPQANGSLALPSTDRDAGPRRSSLPLHCQLSGSSRPADSNAPTNGHHHSGSNNTPPLARNHPTNTNASRLASATNNHPANNATNNNATNNNTTSSFAPRRRRVDRSALCETDFERLGRSMRELEEGCFYYQQLDSDSARDLLQDSPLGTFVVRDSSDARFLFAISMKTERGPTSVRVSYARGLFQMDCDNRLKRTLPKFETVLELIAFHSALSSEQQQASQYRWLESSNRKDLVVKLSTPRRHSPPSLTHLARLTVNRCLEDLHLPFRSTDLLPVPDSVRQFLRAYPYKL